jgi:hypothetical protein
MVYSAAPDMDTAKIPEKEIMMGRIRQRSVRR